MTSKIFQAVGLGNMDIAIPLLLLLVAVIVLIVMLVMQSKKMQRLQSRYERFMQGGRAVSLEEQMQQLAGDVSRLKKESRAYANDIDLLFSKHEEAIQKIGLVKYDAFAEMGGKMSFCLALLDENNNGVIMNSVHSSNGCYSYIKRIREAQCGIPLSPEETETIRRAMESVMETGE